ncbi:MAG: sulfite exporter TauE/SafE family protein [Proteobacteria bacterium]|nr:sulfite exporter TauE/SafE family protein [Desulfobulbaceae bacterium]MBU4152610.1 sulfite exporter TauE/SafE family protein [Pseudomonadota bacterium]MDP2105075.1 sulfite exporter TauE/SafE family protein [Desulfobulbaceae bacterium]
MTIIILTYLAVGAVAGVLAGLLGIGGGLVIVPMLIFCFSSQRLPHEVIMHLALGTSMASIIFTSISSFLAHHKRGAVHWTAVRRIVPGILTGTFLGSCVAARLSTNFLKGFLVIFLYYVVTQMLMGSKPKAGRELPGIVGISAVGGGIGILSSLVGIGGGTMSVPFLLWSNLGLHQAIGTSAAIGFPIAVSGTLGYLVNGISATELPPFSIGYIYLPALAGIVLASVITAPVGVRLAHSLPVKKLKRIFAILLLVVATKMLLDLVT